MNKYIKYTIKKYYLINVQLSTFFFSLKRSILKKKNSLN